MLEARLLTKYYNHTPAVRQVSFAIRPGEILGYLGPNGAGKSTTVKMLVGLIEPSEGQIFYQGRSVYEDFTAYQRRIGYVPEEPHLYPHLSGREYLQLAGRLRGMPRQVLEPKMDEFLRVFGLGSDSHAPLSSYSKGMRQKILLSAALLHDPDILILDEPFSGLDVTSALMLRSLLRALAERGKIILYSSHVLEVVEKICSTVVILRKGEVVAYDSIERLRELMSQPSLEGVFAQLAEVDDGDEVAERIVQVMSDRGPEAGRQAERPVAMGMRAYRAIANAFPDEFRNVYGDELLRTAEDTAEPVWRQYGLIGLARLVADIAVQLPLQHLAEFGRSLRYALRVLLRAKGFTVVALLSLCLGICVATCAYSEMNGLLRDVPGVAAPDELVALHSPESYPTYKRYRELHDLFSGTFAYVAPVPFDVASGGRSERVWGHLVTPSYFSTLGARPLLGRFFDEADEQAGQTPHVVISDRLWRDRLGSDPSIIGRELRINGYGCTVIGIGRKEFRGASPVIFPADLWLPVSVDGRLAPEMAGNALERRDLAMFQVVGRLRPGITEARVKQELDAAGRQLAESYGELDREHQAKRVDVVEGGKALPLRKQDLPFFRQFFFIMGGLILLIACSNVANMMLARAADRRKEIAVRLALGAKRSRLIRQLLTESLLVAAGAAPPAFLLSCWLMSLASRMKMPLPIPMEMDLAPDWRALVFTFVLTGLTGFAFGLVPALQGTRADLSTALKEGGNVRLRKYRALTLRKALVLCQMAASLTLLLLTGYLGMGIQSTLGVQQGFDPKNLYLLSLDPVRDGYSARLAADFFEKLRDRVKALPGVTSVCLTDTLPVATDGNPGVRFSSPDRQAAGAPERYWARRHIVGRGYFETAGVKILAGRSFERQDEEGRTAAVIVSQTAVPDLWKGEDPVGRRIEIRNDAASGGFGVWPGTFDYRSNVLAAGSRVFEVIGVARDVSEDIVASKKHPAIYFPLDPADYAQPSLRGMTLMVRAAPGVDAIRAVESEIAAMDSTVTPFNARSMMEQIDQYMSALKGASWTYGMMGFFGLVLAAVGVAGVTAYSVAQRGHEIGIRMALGARKRNVLALVMKEGAALVTVGTAAGLALAWAGMRALSSYFFTVASVRSNDPVLLVGAPLLLAGLALLACYLPARRSMRIDPVVTLRQE
ncbi:MAG TPA: ADOP family duplicated permease [Bryobacteraceae bacterium]|nr:ADOP family duplicated permease [Bryobacteraceae bacterium]